MCDSEKKETPYTVYGYFHGPNIGDSIYGFYSTLEEAIAESNKYGIECTRITLGDKQVHTFKTKRTRNVLKEMTDSEIYDRVMGV